MTGKRKWGGGKKGKWPALCKKKHSGRTDQGFWGWKEWKGEARGVVRRKDAC